MSAILQARGVGFREILRYPDIAIMKEGATFLTGPSGSGKSTLLRLFNATHSPDQGALYYGGRDISGLDPIALRREVLLCGQSAFLFPGSIQHNFAQFADYRGQQPPGTEAMAQCLALCQANFGPAALCDTMSGGERQRVFLALCLSLSPKVLMLDEPTSALDSATADAMMVAVKAHCAHRGITLVVVSHDQSLTQRYADREILLRREVV